MDGSVEPRIFSNRSSAASPRIIPAERLFRERNCNETKKTGGGGVLILRYGMARRRA
jgi:hypothetical protein